MNMKPTLIGGVALSALVSISMAGGAQARARHHRKVAGPSAAERALRAEVDGLKQEVNSLESRLDAQTAVQQQTQAQVQAVQTQAQAAQTTAQAAQTQVATQQTRIETIPGEIETATAKAAPKPGWWNNTTVGATIFADLSYIRNQNDGVSNKQTGTDYDIKRAYIIVDHRFNDVWSANFTSDFIYDSTSGATQLFVKKAYLQAHLNDAFTVRAGASDLPWVPFVESLYGYRYVEKTFIDDYGYGMSTDWGVHVFGSLLDHHVGYALSVIDGSGFKVPATGVANRTDTMDVEGRVNATFSHFTVAVGGYDGKLGKSMTTVPTFHTAERFDAIAAYTDSRVRAGVEYTWARYFGGDILQPDPAKTNKAEGVGAFASWNFLPRFSIFGRYDYLKPKEDTQPNFHSNYYNVGVSYKPIGPLDFALVYKHDSVVDGLLSTANGSIGTLNANNIGKGDYDEVGIFTQVKF
ncbi:MAG TPA: porin [Caulobacteraceae bacterium]|jgi:hypothetical protein|nr:porin [Caulobacteraceae bacterium]